MKVSCWGFRRKMLKNLEREKLPERYARHTTTCPSCRLLYANRGVMRETLVSVVQDTVAKMVPPQFPNLEEQNPPTLSLPSFLPGLLKVASITVIIFALGVFGYFGFREFQTRRYIRAETSQFVEQLFHEPLFAEVATSFSPEGGNDLEEFLSDYLVDPEGVTTLVF